MSLPHPPLRHEHEHDLGLAHDLRTLAAAQQQQHRRQALRWLAGAGAGLGVLPLWGCGGGGDTASSTDTDTIETPAGTCSAVPEETAGPYPADGSNSDASGSISNALALSGIVRSDIRSSIAGLSGTADGVPLTVTLKLVNSRASCADLSGYAIYLWHGDREGRYSLYSSGATEQNYLRGVQETDSTGQVTFTTIFPACYSGRMPHIHFEVYRSLATATGSTGRLKTSQLAFPTDVCQTAYATTGYSASVSNLSRIGFSTDNVFSDGVSLQMAAVTGSVADGLVAELTVGIAA